MLFQELKMAKALLLNKLFRFSHIEIDLYGNNNMNAGEYLNLYGALAVIMLIILLIICVKIVAYFEMMHKNTKMNQLRRHALGKYHYSD